MGEGVVLGTLPVKDNCRPGIETLALPRLALDICNAMSTSIVLCLSLTSGSLGLIFCLI